MNGIERVNNQKVEAGLTERKTKRSNDKKIEEQRFKWQKGLIIKRRMTNRPNYKKVKWQKGRIKKMRNGWMTNRSNN